MKTWIVKSVYSTRVMFGYRTANGAVRGFTMGNAADMDPTKVAAGWETTTPKPIKYQTNFYQVYGPF